jgi:hypothetical protein
MPATLTIHVPADNLRVSEEKSHLAIHKPASYLRVSTPPGALHVTAPIPTMGIAPSTPSTLRISQQKVASFRFVCSGPPGPRGEPGAAVTDAQFVAGETLGGHRVVRASALGAVYADAFTAAAFGVLGVTTHAATQGALVSVRVSGEMTEPSWAWQPGPVYAGAQGALTQTPPMGATVVEIGVASAPTVLQIRVQPEVVDG